LWLYEDRDPYKVIVDYQQDAAALASPHVVDVRSPMVRG
jgi:hypothetical protein